MKTYILVGEEAITAFYNSDWLELEEIILQEFNGDILSWNKTTDSVAELLNMLNGWTNFIELSKKDLVEINENSLIKFV